jgi:hypothetical protein
LSGLFKDVFLYHWREESQHAILDELEWRREDARLTDNQRDQSVDDLIELVGALDQVLQAQAEADAVYFMQSIERSLSDGQSETLRTTLLRAYRWQYIVSGVQDPRFLQILQELVSEDQRERIVTALAAIIENGSPRDSIESTALAA